MVFVIGMAEYFFYQAKESGARITKKAAFERGIQELLAYYGLNPTRAKRLAETAMRIHRDMIRDLGLLPIK
jgi:GTP cyclohydrolase I